MISGIRLINYSKYTKYTGIGMKVRVGLTINPELLEKIEAFRGMVKRSTFIEHLVELGLETYERQNKRSMHKAKSAEEPAE